MIRDTVVFISGVAVGATAMIALAAIGWFEPDQPMVEGQEWGQFTTSPSIRLLDGTRLVELLEDFTYLDPRGKAWTATTGLIFDGASIPQYVWSFTGGPYDGLYRNAAIIHDQACGDMFEPSNSVHLMFYEACRCGGVDEHKAKLLYWAVYHCGPSWELKPVSEIRVFIDDDGNEKPLEVTKYVAEQMFKSAPEPSEDQLKRLAEFIQNENPSLSEIESLSPYEL